MHTFEQFNLSEELLSTLEQKGFTSPTHIQALVIPEILKDTSDIVAQAQTGTGKTAAFAIPIIEMLKGHNKIQVLVLTPTRELANQVADEIRSMSYRKMRVIAVYGGQSIDRQIADVKRGADILVGTPGRVIDLLNRKVLNFKHLRFFVLDEADEMLNMGFIEAIETIFTSTNSDKRVLLFSATISPKILGIAKNYMKNHVMLKAASNSTTASLVEQVYFEVSESDKLEALCRILDYEQDFYGIVFVRTRQDAEHLATTLKERRHSIGTIHGDITQFMRNKTLADFKKRAVRILIATDVAARGLDIDQLSHVVNYSLPQELESYVHRIGRTGRAGNTGVAITLVNYREVRKINDLARITGADILRKELPAPSDVVAIKMKSLQKSFESIIADRRHEPYIEFADKILAEYSSDQSGALASILFHFLGTALMKNQFVEIRSGKRDSKSNASSARERQPRSRDNKSSSNRRTPRRDERDLVRLFVATGKVDGMSLNKLLELLRDQSGIAAHNIHNVDIFDTFSFISVPKENVDDIMGSLNKKRKMVSIAKART